MRFSILTTIAGCLLAFSSVGQTVMPREWILFHTSEWTGERFEDGRPKAPEEYIERLKNLSVEEVWGFLRNKGYNNQFEGGWEILNPEEPFAGRVLTAQYMPARPDINKQILDKGHAEGRIGPSNSWPIDMLREGDVYVADGFGKIIDGTLIGDNLGNAIYARSKRGVVFDAGVRDMEGLSHIEGFNAFVRGFDPSFLRESMLTGINVPIRIGRAVVIPGDVVLAKKSGVVFVPPHLLKETVLNGEFVALRDKFGHQMLRQGVYTPGQIDTQWTDEIKNAFLKWLDANPSFLPMSRKELDDYMKERTW
jgi:4-hydroxy-4-methyl-2-oxoglutarate aldolase